MKSCILVTTPWAPWSKRRQIFTKGAQTFVAIRGASPPPKTDQWHGAFDFEDELPGAPEELRHLVWNHDSITWRWKGFERKTVLDQILQGADSTRGRSPWCRGTSPSR